MDPKRFEDFRKELENVFCRLKEICPAAEEEALILVEKFPELKGNTDTGVTSHKRNIRSVEEIEHLIRRNMIKRDEDYTGENPLYSNYEQCKATIQKFKSAINNNEKKSILYGAFIGEAFIKMKEYTKQKTVTKFVHNELQEFPDFSPSYVRFLMQLSEHCHKFTDFIQCGLSLYFVKNNFPKIREASSRIWSV